MTSTWIGVTIFIALFAVGLGVMLGGLLLVARTLLSRPKPAPISKAAPVTAAATLRPDALVPRAAPPAQEWDDDVPTAVFRASDYKDIEALMQDADKYVSKHKNED